MTFHARVTTTTALVNNTVPPHPESRPLLQVLRWGQTGQKACYAAFAVLFLSSAAALGRGFAVYSPPLVCMAVAALAIYAVLRRLTGLTERLTFTDWSQTDNT